MPSYTLYYFNGRGRAEICRILFAAAEVKYFDKRFEFTEWERYRNDMPGMCLPVLEMDEGTRMPETMAISRYLAREFGYHGRNSVDMLKVDYICDCFYEIMHDYMRYFHWKNGRFRSQYNLLCSDPMGKLIKKSPETDSKHVDSYLQVQYLNTCNRVLPFLEKNLACKTGSNFFLGDQMLLCDMMCYSCLENPFLENKAMFGKYPNLIKLRDHVAAHPKICAYLKSRCISKW